MHNTVVVEEPLNKTRVIVVVQEKDMVWPIQVFLPAVLYCKQFLLNAKGKCELKQKAKDINI